MIRERESHPITGNLQEDSKIFCQLFQNCSDFKHNQMYLGKNHEIPCFIAFIETTVGNMMVDQTALGKMISGLCSMSEEEVYEALEKNSLGVSDIAYYRTIEEAVNGMLTGAALLMVDGFTRAIKIEDKGYPGMMVNKTDSEKVIRGSNEGFTDSVKTNAALIRKRIRSPQLKVLERKAGVRSNTNISLLYMEGIAPKKVLEEIDKRLSDFSIDGVMDSGVIEQLAEKDWMSPFPQFQTTLRPDRAAMSVLEGRVVLLCDNSPVALILPTDYNSFIQTSDDYYNRFEIASFGRILRYLASFFAMTLPGLYLAMTNFHTQLLPTTLILSFAAARQGVPFPAVFEVILMELSFELLREAGVRLPGAMGNTIGIVGGLIIGQAAVEANIVSPVVVIVVAFTALCSFAIPNEEFATAFRILKFFVIAMSAWLGFFGFLVSLLAVLIHLAHLKSFGIPYLMPYVGAELTNYDDERDSLLRMPIYWLTRRPIFASSKNKTRLRRRK
ncbi:MAG: spore germination protein [Lachnospiraceae bacterium]|nr:spore germination protein [Lachnospiraceae bacterium]